MKKWYEDMIKKKQKLLKVCQEHYNVAMFFL